MPSSTPKYVIPYAVLADTVASVAQTTQDLATRADLLLGESGQLSITGAANTTISVAVVLSRTYPGNSGAAVPGFVGIQPVSSLSSANNLSWWISGWTGTATTITGFTFNCQLSSAPSGRLVNWRFLPVL